MPSPKELLNKLSPDALFMLFGWSDEEFQQLSAKMRGDTDSTPFFSGGKFTDADLDESLKRQESRVNEVVQSQTVSGIINASNRILQERFDYQIMPAFSVGTQVMGGLHKSIMDALTEARAIQHEYGLMAKNIVTGVGVSALTAYRIGQELRAARTVVGVVNTTRRLRTAGRVLRALWLVGSKFNPVTAAISIGIELAAWAAYSGVSKAVEGHARNLSMGNVAADMLNKQIVVNDFLSYRGTVPGGPSGVYDRFDDTLSKQVGGGDLSRFGINYKQMSELSRTLRLNAPIADEHYDDYMAEALHMKNLFGADTDSLLVLASRINPDKEIGAATRLFSQFFASVLGDLASPQASQLELTSDLMQFTLQYAQGTKFNVDGGDTVAAIASFMFGAYNKNTVEPITNLITGTDNIMSNYTGNYSLNLMMEAVGLNITDMIMGVTSSPEVMEKYLTGIMHITGIGHQSFDSEGNLNDEMMTVLGSFMIQNLGASAQDVQALIPALHKRALGHRITQVDIDDFESWKDRASQVLGGHEVTKLADVIQQGERALTSAINNNLSLLSQIDAAIVEAYTNKVPGIVNEVGRVGLTVQKLLGGEAVGEGGVYPVEPKSLYTSGAAGQAAARSLSAFYPKVNQGAWDTRFSTFSNQSQMFQLTMYGLMAGDLGFRVTGAVGIDYSGINKTGPNYGADIVIGAAGSESPVIFPFKKGTVIYAGNRITNNTKQNTYGKSVVIGLGDGLSVSFSHLSRILVSTGETVRYGDVVGYQGATGAAFGSHVDIEFRENSVVTGDSMGGNIVYNAERIAELFQRFLPGEIPTANTSLPSRVDSGGTSGYNEEYAQEDEDVLSVDVDLGAYGHEGYVDEFLRLLSP